MKGIADTGFLVAFANRNDRHHKWAVLVAEQVTARDKQRNEKSR